MRSLLLSVIGLPLLLTSCATFPSGTISYDSVYYPEETRATVPARLQVPVSFSVRLDNRFGEDAWVSQGQVAAMAQQALQQSGLFSSVLCVPEQQAGPNHLAFEVTLRGLSPAKRLGIGLLGGLTLTTIPVWTTLDMDIRVTARCRKRELLTCSTQQSNTEILWAPLVLAASSCDHDFARRTALENAMEELLQTMRDQKLTQQFRKH